MAIEDSGSPADEYLHGVSSQPEAAGGEEAVPELRQATAARPGIDFVEPETGPESPPVFPSDRETARAIAAARSHPVPFPPGVPATSSSERQPPREAPTAIAGASTGPRASSADLIAEARKRAQISPPEEAEAPLIAAAPPSAEGSGYGWRWVALAALLLAAVALAVGLLSGTTPTTSTTVPAHSIGSAQIIPGSLIGADFAPGSLPSGTGSGKVGPTGATGPAGRTGSRGLAGKNGTNGANGKAGKNGAVGATGAAGAGTGTAGPRGPAGPAGPAGKNGTGTSGGFTGVTEVSQSIHNQSGSQTVQVSCAANLKVISGGASISGGGAVLTSNTISGNGWSASATQLPSSASPYGLTVTAVCAQ